MSSRRRSLARDARQAQLPLACGAVQSAPCCRVLERCPARGLASDGLRGPARPAAAARGGDLVHGGPRSPRPQGWTQATVLPQQRVSPLHLPRFASVRTGAMCSSVCAQHPSGLVCAGAEIKRPCRLTAQQTADPATGRVRLRRALFQCCDMTGPVGLFTCLHAGTGQVVAELQLAHHGTHKAQAADGTGLAGPRGSGLATCFRAGAL